MIIAIDGPAGTGKSTVSKLLAEKLGFEHLNSGIIFRIITWNILQQDIPFDNIPAIIKISRQVVYEFIDTTHLRDTIVSDNVAIIAQIPEVRQIAQDIQREYAETYNVVVEGRDIGTMVFPQAEYKFYLDASVEVRTERRYQELISKGELCDKEEIKQSIIARDTYDSSREHSPLRPADDAIIVDTGNLSIEEVLNTLIQYINPTHI
jgi:cytidylate kinase